MPSLSYLAILTGALIVFTRIPGIFYPKAYAKFIKGMMKETMLMRVISVMGFMLSVSILTNAWMVTPDWQGAFVLLGWLMLAGCVNLAYNPKSLQKIVKKVIKNEATLAALCFVGVVIGGGLIYLGLEVF
jgi:hypothetical protein